MRSSIWPTLLVLVAGTLPSAAEVQLARAGRALAPIVVADEATEAERTAAEELARYLARVAGSPFEVVDEATAGDRAPAIHVGPTRLARERVGLDPADPPAESWFVLERDGRLLLGGGRPRGTLYAVYHFLEDQVGVHWWTPWDETVPALPDLAVHGLDASGAPAFASRDVPYITGPPIFAARNRTSGFTTRLPDSLGGRQEFGREFHVHTFAALIPPERWFRTHPEWFSEIGGMRFGGEKTQLCLTQAGLLDEAERVLRERIEASRETDPTPPGLWSVSQNDWGRPCACAACTALSEREGSRAAPLIAFVNALAERLAADYPELRLDTLAYHWTLTPPLTLRPSARVQLRVSGLYERDFSKPFAAPQNAPWRSALEGWAAGTPHLLVWDYTVVWGDAGELPLPNLSFMARDYRAFRALGVEGVLAEHPFPVLADLRDLKLWVQLKLLEDPDQDAAALIRTFTDGYYGRAGAVVRRYVRQLARAAARHPGTVRYGAKPQAYRWLLEPRFMVHAHRSFDAAERAVADDPLLVQRVRHARLSLDRATLVLWPTLAERVGGEAELARRLSSDAAAIAGRYRATALAEAERRLLDAEIAELRATVEAEVAPFLRAPG